MRYNVPAFVSFVAGRLGLSFVVVGAPPPPEVVAMGFFQKTETACEQMVARQLIARGIRSKAVLDAMSRVPRERFLPATLADEAYADRAVSIDCEQTISQPYMVALMTELLELSGNEHVLEIGTGSGYQTALLAELAHDVVSVERHVELSQQAAGLLAEMGYGNVRLVVGDGTFGYLPVAPYDRVLVTAAAAEVPAALFEQLVEGGLLVLPVGDARSQTLQLVRKIAGRPEVTPLSSCRFVPLVGVAQPQEPD